jgi:hypothetical protein
VAQEQWRNIEGWPYEVSSLGRIRRSAPASGTRPGLVLIGTPNPQGYLRVGLRRDGARLAAHFFVHQVVARAFLGNPPEDCAPNHKNGVKDDNRADNLEWCTRSENQLHAYRTGLQTRGAEHGRAKLTDKKVRAIRARYAQGDVSTAALARKYHVSQPLISQIVRRKIWTHLE